MAREKKRKAIHYKLATISEQSLTLQELLQEALSSTSPAHVASQRIERTNPNDDSVCRLINYNTQHQGMFFAELVRFESGRSQTLLTLDDQATSYSIDAITSEAVVDPNEPTDEEKIRRRREFIDSILHFGVLDDHVVVMQSQALTTRELEAHLAWLLGQRLDLLDSNSMFMLQDKITEDVRKKVESSPAKSVYVGTPVEATEHVDDEKSKDEGKGVKWIPAGKGANILAAALGNDWLNRLNLSNSLDEANLQVQLKVTYLRKTTKAGQSMLDNIASSMRHMHDDDVTVELTQGGKIQGKDIRLNGTVSVLTENGIVDRTDLYHNMHNWLVQKIEASEVEPREIDSDENDNQ